VTERQLRIRRRIVLLYLYCLWALWAVYRVLTEAPVATESGLRMASCAFVALALGSQLGFMWFCTLDARLVGKPLPQLARIGIFLGWPLGVPIYLVWARRFRGVGLLLLHGAGLFLISAIAVLIPLYLRDGSPAFTWVLPN
jgi:hypothetical protein